MTTPQPSPLRRQFFDAINADPDAVRLLREQGINPFTVAESLLPHYIERMRERAAGRTS